MEAKEEKTMRLHLSKTAYEQMRGSKDEKSEEEIAAEAREAKAAREAKQAAQAKKKAAKQAEIDEAKQAEEELRKALALYNDTSLVAIRRKQAELAWNEEMQASLAERIAKHERKMADAVAELVAKQEEEGKLTEELEAAEGKAQEAEGGLRKTFSNSREAWARINPAKRRKALQDNGLRKAARDAISGL